MRGFCACIRVLVCVLLTGPKWERLIRKMVITYSCTGWKLNLNSNVMRVIDRFLFAGENSLVVIWKRDTGKTVWTCTVLMDHTQLQWKTWLCGRKHLCLTTQSCSHFNWVHLIIYLFCWRYTVLIWHNVGQGFKASSPLINFRAHKVQPLLFRISDMISVEPRASAHPPFITVSRTASSCSECREHNWSMKTARRHFSPKHARSASLACWVILISKHYLLQCTMFSAGSPPNTTISHPSYVPTECWMCDSSRELLCTDNLPFPL